MYKCINCIWSGKDVIKPLNHCPKCGDNTITIKEEIKEVKKEIPKKLKERIKDFTSDILDDGKRNYSSRKKKTTKKRK